MKVAIVGSRTLTSHSQGLAIIDFLDAYHAALPITAVVCGEAKGPDTWGKEWAHENHIEVLSYPAMWDVHGKAAGYMRNVEMAKVCDRCIAFMENDSRGTAHMVKTVREMGKPCVVIPASDLNSDIVDW